MIWECASIACGGAARIALLWKNVCTGEKAGVLRMFLPLFGGFVWLRPRLQAEMAGFSVAPVAQSKNTAHGARGSPGTLQLHNRHTFPLNSTMGY